ncbi:MAG: FHA domain-containing protein [Chloroflexi bacterium]|nr:FHA domain-containing protein [Chloroflexota bacterium]
MMFLSAAICRQSSPRVVLVLSGSDQPLGRLIIEGPGGERQERLVAGFPLTLGRAEENGVVLADPAVSRRHAVLAWHEDAIALIDLGSLNGTTVNSVRLAAHRPFALRGGDQITIGPYRLMFEQRSLPAPEPGQRATLELPTFPVGTPSAGTLPSPGAAREHGEAATRATTVLPTSGPHLLVWLAGQALRYPLVGEVITLGRGPRNTIVLPDPTVGECHAEVRRTPTGWELVEVGSGPGIYHHGQRIARKLLENGDSFRLGEGVHLVFVAGEEVPSTPQARTELAGRSSLTIGRDETNDLTLAHPQVSRFHARIERHGERYLLVDLGSTNGTFLNGRRIKSAPLQEGDQFQIGPYALVLVADAIEPASSDGAIRLDALALCRTVGGGKTILHETWLTIHPREFVAIVGPSGAGKSTLLDALCGYRPATSGVVLYNGQDLYQNYDAFRTATGYVPQEDIIHRDLPLRQALRYAAALRLPPDTTRNEREARIDEVLLELGLKEQEGIPIARLSGGQRKRASIGVELLTRPSLFFLDEPMAGLDPATTARMMRLLRELADQGRTLVLVTHATEDILLCDKVIVLARGGQVAFFGAPREALDFFGVQEFVAIYDRLEREPSPGHYAERYRASPYAALHLGEVAGRRPEEARRARQRRARPARSVISPWRQFAILTQRSAELLLANRRALAVLGLQVPVLAILTCLVFSPAVFSDRPLLIPLDRLVTARVPPPTALVDWPRNCGLTAEEVSRLPTALQGEDLTQPCGNARDALALLFVITLVAIWLGTSNAAKEIVKELPVYRRERMVALGLLPYLGSKLTVLGVVAAGQAALLLGIITTWIAFPLPTVEAAVGLVATVLLTFLAATAVGLAISAVAATSDEAGNLVPVLLIPQIVLAGMIFPLPQMGEIARWVANFTLSKWSWEALGAILDLPRIARAQGGESLSLLTDTTYGRTFAISVEQHLAILGLFLGLAFLVGLLALRRKDSL